MIYLDNAATTLKKPPEVLDAVNCALGKIGSVGRGSHRAADMAAEIVYECRREAAELFEAQQDNVVFTFNATHGLNIAIKSLLSRGDRVVISGFEHNAVLRPLYEIGADIVVAGRKVFDRENTFHEFSALIDSDTKAVICAHVSNVYGYVLPIEQIAALCKERNIPFIVDAAQSAGVLPISMKRLKAAFIAMPGHKSLFGPQGTGILLCGNVKPKTIIEGGTGSSSRSVLMPQYLPDRLEAGTLNCHGIAGLRAGIRYIRERGIESIRQHDTHLLRVLQSNLSVNDLKIFGCHNDHIGVLSVVPDKMSCEELGDILANAGFAVRTGLHCAPLAHESGKTEQTGTVRISVSALTEVDEVLQICDFIDNYKKL